MVKRKRFVRMLMGLGVSRNEANKLAAHYRAIGLPYREGIWDYALGVGSTSREDFLDFMEYLITRVREYQQNGESFVEGLLALARDTKNWDVNSTKPA